jgi:hypothetical protein
MCVSSNFAVGLTRKRLATAGHRGKHAPVASPKGRWLHRLVKCHELRARAKSCSGTKIQEMNSAEPLFDQQVSYRPAEALLESIANQIVYPSECHPTVG